MGRGRGGGGQMANDTTYAAYEERDAAQIIGRNRSMPRLSKMAIALAVCGDLKVSFYRSYTLIVIDCVSLL